MRSCSPGIISRSLLCNIGSGGAASQDPRSESSTPPLHQTDAEDPKVVSTLGAVLVANPAGVVITVIDDYIVGLYASHKSVNHRQGWSHCSALACNFLFTCSSCDMVVFVKITRGFWICRKEEEEFLRASQGTCSTNCKILLIQGCRTLMLRWPPHGLGIHDRVG